MPFHITTLDIIDIVLVAFIMFQIYRLIRGTAAFSIFIGIFFIYLFWLIVKALNMELITALLGQVMGVGVIALIIVFQQEVRRFLLVIGNRYISSSRFSLGRFFFPVKDEQGSPREAEEIVRACESMASKRTGALIVIGRKSSLDIFTEGGEILKAQISAELLETIFFKNTPLHDGAVLIEGTLFLLHDVLYQLPTRYPCLLISECATEPQSECQNIPMPLLLWFLKNQDLLQLLIPAR